MFPFLWSRSHLLRLAGCPLPTSVSKPFPLRVLYPASFLSRSCLELACLLLECHPLQPLCGALKLRFSTLRASPISVRPLQT